MHLEFVNLHLNLDSKVSKISWTFLLPNKGKGKKAGNREEKKKLEKNGKEEKEKGKGTKEKDK